MAANSFQLQDFVIAKEKINEIFVGIEVYIRDTVTYMQSVQQVGSIVKCDDAVQLERYEANVGTIRNMLTRIHMKVVFFGRTSNGKSSVINAMLREKILPRGCGHTTNCFLQLEESDSGESYLVTEGSTEKQNVESVGQLANALSNKRLGESQLVHIYWPKEKCLLLRDDVVFVDSPGVDMSPNVDKWIDKYCRDADVFVFVANAQSTLTLAETNFFREVSKQVAKPNIFILYNHWDVVVSEDDSPDQVRTQHMEQAVEILVTELKVCTQSEANQRIFFVSAKEALQAHLQEQKGPPAQSGSLADGFPKRYSEFQDFEQKFKECISKSAVRTKFEKHFERGKHIVSEIQKIIDSTCDQAEQLRTQKAVAKKEMHNKLNSKKEELLLLTQEMKDRNQQMVEDVEQMVSTAFSEEIGHLSVLVDEFNFPFHSKQPALDQYKRELIHHVKNRLGSKLHARLSIELAKNIENSRREMTERMSCLLPAEKKNALPQQELFEIFYCLNRDELCADFHEDLDFKTSGKVLQTVKAAVVRTAKAITAVGATLTGVGTATVVAVEVAATAAATETVTATGLAAIAVVDGVTTATVGLAGTVALGVVGTTTAAAAAGTIYGAQYLCERVAWNDEAKEKQFKRQSVAHVTKKLRMIVDSTSANCSKQVEKELSSTFASLSDLVKKAINDMDAEIKTLDEEIKQLEEAANSAEILRNKANYITKQFEIFYDAFLKLRN